MHSALLLGLPLGLLLISTPAAAGASGAGNRNFRAYGCSRMICGMPCSRLPEAAEEFCLETAVCFGTIGPTLGARGRIAISARCLSAIGSCWAFHLRTESTETWRHRREALPYLNQSRYWADL